MTMSPVRARLRRSGARRAVGVPHRHDGAGAAGHDRRSRRRIGHAAGAADARARRGRPDALRPRDAGVVRRGLSADPDVAAFIRFQTGAPIADDPAKAGFAFAVDMAGLPPLSAFAQGTDDYPDRSTTLILAVEAFGSGRRRP